MTTFTWKAGNGGWSNAADWTPAGGPPRTGDVAVFGTEASSENVLGNGTADRLILDQAYVSFSGDLTLAGATGTALTVIGSDGFDFIGNVTAPTVVLEAAPNDVFDGGFFNGGLVAASITVSSAPHSTERVSMRNLQAGSLTISAVQGVESAVTFTGAASTQSVLLSANTGAYSYLVVMAAWTNAGSVTVGGRGNNNELLIDASARIGYQGQPGNLIIASVAGGSGVVGVVGDGPGLTGTLNVANRIEVGAGGSGILSVGQGESAHAGALQVSAGSTVELQGYVERQLSFAQLSANGGTIEAGGTLIGAGILQVEPGFVNDGTISANGYLLMQDGITDNGVIDIGSGDVRVNVGSEVLGAGSIAFASGGGGELVIGAMPTIDPTLTGFAAGDAIRALGIDGVSYDPTEGRLALLSGSAVEGSLTLAGSYVASGFQVSAQGNQGIITYAAGAHPAG